MNVMYFNCFAGISGNMLLGALLDLGLPEQLLREELSKLAVSGYKLLIDRVTKCGVSAVYVDVKLGWRGDHHHRHLPDIVKIIDQSTLADGVKEKSKTIFYRLAEAEAKVHGTTIDKIHFHEVGAIDSIVDIVGTAVGLDYFGIERIYASKLQTGCGFIKCSHGRMPVPAPATAELLQAIPYYQGEIAKELVTPTGAAVLSALGNGYGNRPDGFVSQRTGYGAGTWDLDIPNVLRAELGKIGVRSNEDEILVIEANIDDLNPQIYPYVMDKLFALDALDVWLTPIIMKKGRPATKLSILVSAGQKERVAEILFHETSTIGMRYYPVNRTVAEREITMEETPWGPVRVKVSSYQGKVCNIVPEFEDCRKIADEQDIPLKIVQQAALLAAQRSKGG